MADTGAPFSVPFVEPSDLVRDWPGISEDVADKVEEYLLLTETGPHTANYTLALTDTSRVVAMNPSGTATVTVPDNTSVAFPVGSVVGVYNLSEFAVTLVGAGGVTVRNAGDVLEFREVSLRKRATNEWVVAGL
jgi:hypothetical protein